VVAQAVVLGLQVIDPPLEGLAVGAPDRFHGSIIPSSGTGSGADGTQEWFSLSFGR
jgi:hypothetical protein